MAVINKGISQAVKEAFINGTHEPEAMLVKLAHINTDDNRKSYLINLTKDLREKYGMDVERNKNFGRKHKKTGAKSKYDDGRTQSKKSKPTQKQFALNFKNAVHPNGLSSPAHREQSMDIFSEPSERPTLETRNNLQQLLERHLPTMGEGKTAIFRSPVSIQISDAMRKHDMSDIVEVRKNVYKERISDEDRIVEEYVKLDDAHKELQFKYDELADGVAELKREIARLQVIITYLEGKK